MSGQFALLAQRRFAPFFGAQALGAFNDNLLKNSLVILAAYQGVALTAMDPGLLSNLASGLFVLPYLLFSGIAGQFADRLDKSLLIRAVKGAEVGIMGLAGVGFATRQLPLLLGAVFLMGLHSTFFAPAKYGLLASLMMPRLPAVAPGLTIDWNPWRSGWANVRAARQSRTAFLSILGISWFWAYGALVLAQLPIYSRVVLNADERVLTLLLVLFSIGVAVGSLLCDRLSGRKVEIGLVRFGSIGLTVFALDLYFATPLVPIAPRRRSTSVRSRRWSRSSRWASSSASFPKAS